MYVYRYFQFGVWIDTLYCPSVCDYVYFPDKLPYPVRYLLQDLSDNLDDVLPKNINDTYNYE